MLPIVLVLLVASSALAAPSVSVSQYPINSIAPAQDNGALVSSYLVDRSLELSDGGDTNIYILTIQEIQKDLSNSRDRYSQALAISQLLGLLGELATGNPGNACAAASAINSFVNGGNASGYLSEVSANIDLIAQLANNPNSLRFATGPSGNCAGGGRNYQFEAAWDAILDRAGPYSIGLINEEYCAAKRLYNAFNVRSNNVGAAITAASLPSVVNAIDRNLEQAANFLRVVINGGNASAAAAALKSALRA